jgi:hypothetical protein
LHVIQLLIMMDSLVFLHCFNFQRPPELQKGVPADKVKGAALLGAALALLATKGVVISSAAGASAAYAALQQGTFGDVFRTVGGATWDATEAATQLARQATVDKRVTGMTKELAATVAGAVAVAGAVDRYNGAEDEVTKSRQGSDMEEIEAADQTLEESSEDLARILEEAEAAIGQADVAMALADQTLGKESQKEEADDDVFVPVEEIVMEEEVMLQKATEVEAAEEEWGIYEAADDDDFVPVDETVMEGEEAQEEVVLQKATAVEATEEEGGEDDEMDEWAMTLEMAQQGIDGKIIGMDEVINDDGAKATWDAAGILAKELGQAGSEEQFAEDRAEEEEEAFTLSNGEFEDDDFTSSDSDAEAADTMLPEGDLEDIARAAREAVARMNDKKEDDEEDTFTSSDSDAEDADAMLPEGDLEDIARAAREAVARMNDKYVDDEEDASTSSDSDMEDADAMLPEGGLEDIARAAREAVERMNDKYVDDEEDASTSSDSDMEAFDAMLPEGDLEDIARAAREAVARMDDKYEDNEEEDASTSSDSDMEAFDAMLPEGDLEDIARAAREAVAMLDGRNKENEPEEQNVSYMRDWSKLTVTKLREELRVRGLRAFGRKANLIAALGKYDAEAFPGSVATGRVEESSGNDSDTELDFDDVALAELGRQAREAVLAYQYLDDDNADEVEDDKEESDDVDTKDLFAALNLESLGEKSRAAVDTQPVDEPSDDVLQELEDELALESAKDFSSMTVIELKDELRNRGLKLGGKKTELIERLQSA